MINSAIKDRVESIQTERLKELMISSSGFAFDPPTALPI